MTQGNSVPSPRVGVIETLKVFGAVSLFTVTWNCVASMLPGNFLIGLGTIAVSSITYANSYNALKPSDKDNFLWTILKKSIAMGPLPKILLDFSTKISAYIIDKISTNDFTTSNQTVVEGNYVQELFAPFLGEFSKYSIFEPIKSYCGQDVYKIAALAIVSGLAGGSIKSIVINYNNTDTNYSQIVYYDAFWKAVDSLLYTNPIIAKKLIGAEKTLLQMLNIDNIHYLMEDIGYIAFLEMAQGVGKEFTKNYIAANSNPDIAKIIGEEKTLFQMLLDMDNINYLIEDAFYIAHLEPTQSIGKEFTKNYIAANSNPENSIIEGSYNPEICIAQNIIDTLLMDFCRATDMQ